MGSKWNRYTDDELRAAVASSFSLAGTLRELGYTKITGGSCCNLREKIKRKNIDSSHFTGCAHQRGKASPHKKTADEILVHENSTTRQRAHLLRRALDEIGVEYRCVVCGTGDTWDDKPLTLHVDHIDGDWCNNRRENLRYLCPNCHSQTPTFGSKNII